MKVLLPEIVLTEAEAVWQRRTRELLQKCQDSVRELTRRALDLGGGVKLTLPEQVAIEASYEKVVADILERWKPNIVPLPKVSLDEVARLTPSL